MAIETGPGWASEGAAAVLTAGGVAGSFLAGRLRTDTVGSAGAHAMTKGGFMAFCFCLAHPRHEVRVPKLPRPDCATAQSLKRQGHSGLSTPVLCALRMPADPLNAATAFPMASVNSFTRAAWPPPFAFDGGNIVLRVDQSEAVLPCTGAMATKADAPAVRNNEATPRQREGGGGEEEEAIDAGSSSKRSQCLGRQTSLRT